MHDLLIHVQGLCGCQNNRPTVWANLQKFSLNIINAFSELQVVNYWSILLELVGVKYAGTSM